MNLASVPPNLRCSAIYTCVCGCDHGNEASRMVQVDTDLESIATWNTFKQALEAEWSRKQGWGQVQLVKYSSTSSTRNQVQVQVQVLWIFTNQVLKYIKYWHTKYKYKYQVQVRVWTLVGLYVRGIPGRYFPGITALSNDNPCPIPGNTKRHVHMWILSNQW